LRRWAWERWRCWKRSFGCVRGCNERWKRSFRCVRGCNDVVGVGDAEAVREYELEALALCERCL